MKYELLAELDHQIVVNLEKLYQMYLNDEVHSNHAAILMGKIACLRETRKWIETHD